MKKSLLILTAVIISFSILAYFISQKYLLPEVLKRIENSLAEHTSYKFKIDKPSFSFLKITIPEIEISYKDKTISLKNLIIKPALASIARKEIILQGEGIIAIDKEVYNLAIKDCLLNIKDKSISAALTLDEKNLAGYFKTIAYLEGINFSLLNNIKGTCKIEAKLTTAKEASLLNILFKSKNVILPLRDLEIEIPNIESDYKKSEKEEELKTNIYDFSISKKDAENPILKNGRVSLETDFKKIEITDLNALLKDILWQGNCFIEDIRKAPVMSLNLASSLCAIAAKAKKKDDLITFNGDVSKENTAINFLGKYEILKQTANISASGKSTIAALLNYLEIKLPEKLKAIDAGLEIRNLTADYEVAKKLLSGKTEVIFNNLAIAGNNVARDGSLLLEITGKKLTLKNLLLNAASGSIQAGGFLMLEKNFPFESALVIQNYELKKLFTPFMEKDIGNAYLSLRSFIKGNALNKNSLDSECEWKFEGGNLGKLTFLSQIAKLINRPGLAEISFQKGEGSFKLNNGVLTTPKSYLYSPLLNVLIAGNVNLSGDLNLALTTEFAQQKTETTSDQLLGKLEEILRTGAKELLYKIQISGNVKNPKYILIPVSLDRIFQKILR